MTIRTHSSADEPTLAFTSLTGSLRKFSDGRDHRSNSGSRRWTDFPLTTFCGPTVSRRSSWRQKGPASTSTFRRASPGALLGRPTVIDHRGHSATAVNNRIRVNRDGFAFGRVLAVQRDHLNSHLFSEQSCCACLSIARSQNGDPWRHLMRKRRYLSLVQLDGRGGESGESLGLFVLLFHAVTQSICLFPCVALG